MIGFFDSGVGGLSILQAVEHLLPTSSTVYLADTAHFPYGNKSEAEVQEISVAAVHVLLKYSPTVIVVACNTASTSALQTLRNKFPSLPIIGVVPAIKPATAVTTNRRVALLATERTLRSEAYHDLKTEFGHDITLIDQACPGWVELVEAGHVNDQQATQAVEQIIHPLVEQNVDTFVLGCTHYPFLRPLIERCVGTASHVLDSGEAVAQQVRKVLMQTSSGAHQRQQIFLTNGAEDTLSSFMRFVLGRSVTVDRI